MSPVTVEIREQAGSRAAPVPRSIPALLLDLPKEIVVDWQLPTDVERR